MRNDRFEWDDRKAAFNRRKHGVTFELACLVFDDPSALDELDEDEDEDRYNRVGIANGIVLHVTYTLRGRRNRIISARKASTHEQADYFEQRQDD